MKPILKRLTACAFIAVSVAGCSNAGKFGERTQLLTSEGPSFDRDHANDYLDSLNVMRALVNHAQAETATPIALLADQGVKPQAKIDDAQLNASRTFLFAFVDSRCDAYLDAIFWANRTRGGINRGHDAVGSATTTILAATGAATNVLGLVGAAFGLSGSLFDNYYEAVLYGLEPSSVRHLVTNAQAAVRQKYSTGVPLNEAQLLKQTQDYIRVCTPAHLEFLVNAALQKTGVTTLRPAALPILDFMTGSDGKTYRLRSDGTVIGEDGKEYPFGKGLDGAGIKVACDGSVTVGGNTQNFFKMGLANWKEACDAATKPDGAGDGVADGGAGAPAASPASRAAATGLESADVVPTPLPQ